MCLYSKGLRQLRSQRSCETEPEFLRWGFWRWDTCRLNFSFYICLNCFSPSSCLTFNKQTELTNPGDQLCCLTAPVRLIPVPAVGFLKGNVLKLPYITCHSNIFNKLKTKQNQKKTPHCFFMFTKSPFPWSRKGSARRLKGHWLVKHHGHWWRTAHNLPSPVSLIKAATSDKHFLHPRTPASG